MICREEYHIYEHIDFLRRVKPAFWEHHNHEALFMSWDILQKRDVQLQVLIYNILEQKVLETALLIQITPILSRT